MIKTNTKTMWKPMEIDGAVFTGGVDGLVGIEECTDYDLGSVLSTKKSLKRKAQTVVDDNEVISKKKCTQPLNNKNQNNKPVENRLKKKKKQKNKKNKQNKKDNEQKGSLNEFSPSVKGSTDFKSTNVEKNEDQLDDSSELKSMVAWDFVSLPKPILKGLADQGFTQPTPIQSLTLPPAILGKRDILGAAETGSGKTLAFGLPILTGILKLKEETKYVEKSHYSAAVTVDSDEELELCDELADLEEDGNDSTEENFDEGSAGDDDDDENISDKENTDDEEKFEGSSAEDDGESESDFEETEEDVNGVDEQGIGCVRSINNIKFENDERSSKPLYALILTPTRELAIQIKNHLTAAAKYTNIQVAVVIGGMATVKQERILRKQPEIVVATPGRLWELIEQGNSHLTKVDDVKYLVIDETDRMLEYGHFLDMHNLLERINMNPEKMKDRQNFVFSATLTLVHELPRHLVNKKKMRKRITDLTPAQKLQKVVELLGITDPKVVDITKGTGTSGTLTECRISCSFDEKDYYVYYFLQKHTGRTLIFCNSIGCVKRLTTLLSLLGCSPLPLHASMQQRQRLKNLDRFRDKENSILVATDVAARGLDIPSVEHVLHYQTPRTSESYIHRSGRTARASKQGITVLLVEPTELQNYLRLCRTLGKSEDIPLFPVNNTMLNAVKERVNLARELDKLELQVRKANSESGWLQKAAEEMDIIVDEGASKYDKSEAKSYKKQADVKRKQLTQLLAKPVFPKGFSGKFPLTLADGDILIPNDEKTEKAIDVMKTALENSTKEGKSQRKKAKILFKPKFQKNNEEVKFRRNKKGNQKGRNKNGNKQKNKRK